MMRRYDVVDYWDIWYDEEGQPYVNDSTRVGSVTWDIDEMSEWDIVKSMVDCGYLNQGAPKRVVILWGDDMFFELETIKGIPLYALQVSEDQDNLPPALANPPKTHEVEDKDEQ